MSILNSYAALLTITKIPLAITEHPTDLTFYFGASGAVLSVVATGRPPLAYQWYDVIDGLIVDATQSNYNVPTNDITLDGHQFYCRVTDPYGDFLDSDVATITIREAPTQELADVRVKDKYGTWVSIVGPAGKDGSAGDLIDDTRIRDYLTWSSEKINREIEESQPHRLHSTRHTDVNGSGDPDEADLLAHDGDRFSLDRRTRHVGAYVAGSEYRRGDEVSDGNNLSEALIDGATEQPFVEPIGERHFVYDGTIGSVSPTAKQAIFGQRYLLNEDAFAVGFRIQTAIGASYKIYSVRDPLGSPQYTLHLDFIGLVDGWAAFNMDPAPIASGSVLDLVCVVTEPDPAPVDWTGDWDYITPAEEAVPVAGQAIHANGLTNSLRVHYTDDAAADRTLELQGMAIGDQILVDGMSWSIQGASDEGTYIDFLIYPGTQGADDGVLSFVFRSVAAAIIVVGEDVDYWLAGDPGIDAVVQGLYGADTAYGDIVADDSQYGMDIEIQAAYIPTEWGVKVISAGVVTPADSTFEGADVGILGLQSTTTDQQWKTVSSRPPEEWSKSTLIVIAKRTNGDGYYSSRYVFMDWIESGTPVIDGSMTYALGQTTLSVRAVLNGGMVEVQVRGRNGQDWTWTVRKIKASLSV